MTTRFYDPKHRRLIYIQKNATPEFWNDSWHKEGISREMLSASAHTFVTKVTKKYLRPEDGLILEGGCGKGHHVAALTQQGYRCVGVDFAKQTVSALNSVAPELDIRHGDVTQLDFPDGHFVGYWSLGLIEHDWDGYHAMAQEMARVIAPKGYLFLTFPFMSTLRRIKARLSMYPKMRSDVEPENFYQFALAHKEVIEDFRARGFRFMSASGISGLKGMKDEVPLPFLEGLYRYSSNALVIRGFRAAINRVAPQFAGHAVLLVLQHT